MRTHHSIRAFPGIAASLLIASTAHGVVITITPIETPHCDLLTLPQIVHELGNAPLFPPDELISSAATFTELSACPLEDNPAMINALVVMTNLTGTAWRDVHYVADAPGATGGGGTSISNEDGLVTGGQAFRIDTIGVNKPLVFESGLADGIFAPGETWHFIIQDYVNTLGLPAGLFGSIGVGAGSAGDLMSSGSIIALEVPGPASLMTLAIAGAVPATAQPGVMLDCA